jgi:hypothetical protein
MTKQDKNIRTLIVCFVLLILGLIPLRFVEVKNLMTSYSAKPQVLGEESNVEIEKVDKVDIVLPNAEIDLSDVAN